jgi:GTP-binding protein
MMEIKSAAFLVSSSQYSQCPNRDLPEYAFIGRSNVGKSSLINMLTGFSGLAKTSGTPGKTQLINHFIINENWLLVDLPGYGYAKVSKDRRAIFSKMIENYLMKRENLVCTFALIDIRHDALAIDLEFINWMGTVGLPFAIIFTKADKLSRTACARQVEAYKERLLQTWEELPPYFVSSSETKEGRTEILQYIAQINKTYREQ